MNLDNFRLDYGSSVASVGETGDEKSIAVRQAYHLQKSAISVTTVPIPRERITGMPRLRDETLLGLGNEAPQNRLS